MGNGLKPWYTARWDSVEPEEEFDASLETEYNDSEDKYEENIYDYEQHWFSVGSD